MLSKFKLILASIVAIIGLIAAAFLRGRSSGKQEVIKEVEVQHTKDVEQVSKERVKNIKVVNNVQKEVISNTSSDVDRELEDEWTRK